ncbi:MAG: NUDIX hydrolase [Gammaproteobacteria bacterium]
MLIRRVSIYRGAIIDVAVETVALPNGTQVDLEVIRHPGGAAVVALDAHDRVCLLRQYRYAAQGWIWELPAGKLDADEPPLVAAQRELSEEAQLQAAKWHSLGSILSSPGVFCERVYLFLAQGLTPVAGEIETHEVLEVHWISFAEAIGWAGRGTITDAKTLIGLYRAQQFLAS